MSDADKLVEPKSGKLGIVLNIVVCLCLLAAGAGVAMYFLQNRVAAQKVRRPVVAPMVDTLVPKRIDTKMHLQAMGSVVPAQEVELRPEVSGTVVMIAPPLTPGGLLRAGELMVRLDQREYALEVKKSEIAVQSAEADLAMEQGQQVVAREELQMLLREENNIQLKTDLALRKPQLLQALAALESARANLEQAKLDLERTELRAPFNALVTELSVNVGSQVSSSTAVATIVGTDAYWVEVALPLDWVDRLDWNQDGGVPVKVRPQSGGGAWEGRLMRLSGTLKDETMMAKGIVVVEDPLHPREKGLKPLILGEYVSLEMETAPLNNVFSLPREALREGSTIWVVENGELRVRQVTPVGKDEEVVYLDAGLREGEQVVVAGLSTAVDGMRVQVEGQGAALPSEAPVEAGNASKDAPEAGK